MAGVASNASAIDRELALKPGAAIQVDNGLGQYRFFEIKDGNRIEILYTPMLGTVGMASLGRKVPESIGVDGMTYHVTFAEYDTPCTA